MVLRIPKIISFFFYSTFANTVRNLSGRRVLSELIVKSTLAMTSSVQRSKASIILRDVGISTPTVININNRL